MCLHAGGYLQHGGVRGGDMCALVLVSRMVKSMFSHLLTPAGGTWVLLGLRSP